MNTLCMYTWGSLTQDQSSQGQSLAFSTSIALRIFHDFVRQTFLRPPFSMWKDSKREKITLSALSPGGAQMQNAESPTDRPYLDRHYVHQNVLKHFKGKHNEQPHKGICQWWSALVYLGSVPRHGRLIFIHLQCSEVMPFWEFSASAA